MTLLEKFTNWDYYEVCSVALLYGDCRLSPFSLDELKIEAREHGLDLKWEDGHLIYTFIKEESDAPAAS